MSRHKEVARLKEELGTLGAFDRLYDLAIVHDSVETHAYELRQIRRLQITAKIEALRASRRISLLNYVGVSSGLILLCAVGYVFLRFLL
jgi:hypothetical protein